MTDGAGGTNMCRPRRYYADMTGSSIRDLIASNS